MTFAYDPTRRALVVADPRLTKVLQREPESCATVSEYATRTGIATDRVVALLGPALDEGALGLEVCAEEVFVHTAPGGRPTSQDLPEVAPNLWEVLRTGRTVVDAYALWRLVRGMEHAGWDVETNPRRISFNLGPVPVPPALGLRVSRQIVPVVAHPTTAHMADANGLLTAYSNSGAATLAVVCDSGGLDSMVTAARTWFLRSGGSPRLSVLVLEQPRFTPTVVKPADASVTPRSISVSVRQ